jgi:cytoskeletal protein CcmA (bactofilin family)
MFRSDRKPVTKNLSNETPENQAPLQSWQQTTPEPARPVEPVAPVTTMPVQRPEQPKAIGERDAMARDIKEGVLNGFVGFGTVMAGEAVFKGMLRVDGTLTGQISSEDGTLLIGTNGQVDANVNVSIATIHGTVNGDIVATKRIELGRSAKVVGNIQTPALIVEQGAILEGSCKMLQSNVIVEKHRKEKDHKVTQSALHQSSEISGVTDISDVAS